MSIYSSQAEGRLENSPYFCNSPKDACGIQTKGLERPGVRGSRDSHATIHALRASCLAICDLENKIDCIVV